MRNAGVRQRRQNTGFPPHGVVAVGARMFRRPAKHKPALAATEPEQKVLRTAPQRRNILDRPLPDLLIIHPASESCEIDDFVGYLR